MKFTISLALLAAAAAAAEAEQFHRDAHYDDEPYCPGIEKIKEDDKLDTPHYQALPAACKK